MPKSNHEDHRTNGGLALLIVLAKRKRLMLKFLAIGGGIAVILTLLLPNQYRAIATVLPPKQPQSFASSMVGDLGQLASGMSAKDLLRNPSDLYVSMLNSRTIADTLVDRFSLLGVYGKHVRDEARKRLASLSEITASKEGVISISVEDHDPHRAADLANAYVEELDKLTRMLALTDGARRRLFFEREVRKANDELTSAEQEFRKTQESTGIIQLDSQSRVMLGSVANLKAQLVGKEVELQAMRSYATSNNPDLVRVQSELSALRQQMAKFETGDGGPSVSDMPLGKVPGASLEYLRKWREVKYRESLLQVLTKQYEIARIDESKDPALIQPLDKAIPPETKSWPQRTLLITSLLLLSLFAGMACCLVMDRIEMVKEDPEQIVQLHTLKSYLFEGFDRSETTKTN